MFFSVATPHSKVLFILIIALRFSNSSNYYVLGEVFVFIENRPQLISNELSRFCQIIIYS